MNVVTYTYVARRNPETHDRQWIVCLALAQKLGLEVTGNERYVES